MDENLTESIAAPKTFIRKSFSRQTGPKTAFSKFCRASRSLNKEPCIPIRIVREPDVVEALGEGIIPIKLSIRASVPSVANNRALYSNRGWREKNFENVVFEPVWRGKLFK